MNSENSKTSDSHRVLLNFSNKMLRSDKYVASLNHSIYYTWENIKEPSEIKNLKHQLQHEMKNLNYLIDHILYQINK